MSQLLVVGGPPGAGKSTVAACLAEELEPPTVLVTGDRFFDFLRRGAVAPWLIEADLQNEVVTRAAAAATGQYVAGGYRTVYDGVVGPWSIDRFLAATGLEAMHYVVLLPSVEVCVERVASRTGHGFADEAATRHMHAQFATSSIADRHLVPEAAPVDVLARRILVGLADGAFSYPAR